MTLPETASDRSPGSAEAIATGLGSDIERGLDPAESARRLATDRPPTPFR